MKKNTVTTLLTIIITAIVIMSMASCAATRNGCPSTKDKVGYFKYTGKNYGAKPFPIKFRKP